MRPKINSEKQAWKPMEFKEYRSIPELQREERRPNEKQQKKTKTEEITQEIAAMLIEFNKLKPTKSQTDSFNNRIQKIISLIC